MAAKAGVRYNTLNPGEMMPTKTVQLTCKTDPSWVRVILDHFDEFLADHADCELKASAMALGFVVKCPDRTKIIGPMIDLALEELAHFRQVHRILEKRGLPLKPNFIKDPYVSRLMAHCRSGREERFLDRLLVASIVEARGAERFQIVYRALEDPELKAFYKEFCVAEARHGNLFVNLALEYFDERTVDARLERLVREEEAIIRSLKWRPSLH
ncbi:MAG: hypothetical protein MOGMAGMI_01543 [Candidatus Omnitrophica bacterium]|nr:hypothetical protein [Candidatus Omnitrophota bacterium]